MWKSGEGAGGGQGRNRTADAGLFRAALYHLSYLASTLMVLQPLYGVKFQRALSANGPGGVLEFVAQEQFNPPRPHDRAGDSSELCRADRV